MAKIQLKTLKGNSLFIDDDKEIHRGGEGRIMLIENRPEIVAKLYHKGVLTIDENRFNLLQKLDNQIFIVPQELLYISKKIAGFTMEYAGNEYFPLSSLFIKSFCQRNGIDGKFKIKIAEKLVNALDSAHLNNFVIGDLNQYNVLVNLKGDIKLIDVDSYETLNYKHSGVLLDEVRDYLYQGKVSINSDFFALSVQLFYLLTYSHPFKGIHTIYKTLEERMVNKIPVYLMDPELKTPKCFEPIENKDIQEQFNRLYLKGERFLFSIGSFLPGAKSKIKITFQKIEAESLIIQTIVCEPKIINVQFSNRFGFIQTENKFLIYLSDIKGYLNKIAEFNSNEIDDVYPGNKNLVVLQKGKLLNIQNGNHPVPIANFTIPKKAITYLLDNILLVIDNNQMFWIYIDEILGSSIRIKRTEVFGASFTHKNGLMQNTGGIQRIFYNTGKEIASVKTNKMLRKIFQKSNIGFAEFIENKKINTVYFKINGLNIEYAKHQQGGVAEFAYSQITKNEGYIYEPADNFINVRKYDDFEVIGTISCNYISAGSTLFMTNSGIIAWEDNSVFLINQKI
ncbi:MAG: hypothetical protein U0W24_21720 [Bacteroidales bacterium]